MKQNNISLDKGIHRTPSLGDAGELSECVNLIPQYGELMNIEPPKDTNVTIDSGYKLIYVHSRSGIEAYTNYIVSNGSSVKVNGSSVLLNRQVYSITSVGNTLCIATDEGVYYFVWKDEGYIALGNHLPEIGLSFGMSGHFIYHMSDEREWSCRTGDIDTDGFVADGDAGILRVGKNIQEDVANFVYGCLNKEEAKSKEKGCFNYPFFVRYAVKLYDGSHVMLSPPILMAPNRSGSPSINFSIWSNISSGTLYHNCKVEVNMVEAKLSCQAIDLPTTLLSSWSDVISGVDVFVSPQIQKYKESGKPMEETRYDAGNPQISHAPKIDAIMHTNERTAWNEPLPTEPYRMAVKQSDTPFSPGGDEVVNVQYVLDEYTDAEWHERIASNGTFYKIKSYSIDELGSLAESRKYVEIEKEILDTLETREALVEDTGYSHDYSVANKLFAYNSRLLLADVTRKVSNRVHSESVIPYVGMVGDADNVSGSIAVIYKNGRKVSLTGNENFHVFLHEINNSGRLLYLFYPDPEAIGIQITGYGYNNPAIIPLKKHSTLFGVYAYNDMRQLPVSLDIEASTEGASFNQSNRLFMSEVDNPFVFKGSLALTLPSRVYEVSSASRALSEGQFGQFPIYAFSEDGIWAVEVDTQGRMSARQPISRDVILPGSSVCQLDDSVVFITKEGVKIIRGSNSQCISEPIHGLNFNETQITNMLPESYKSLVVTDSVPFFSHLAEQNPMLVYDYPHGMLHLFTDTLNKANVHYVNVLGSSEWAMQMLDAPLVAQVPGYPLTHLQFGQRVKVYDHLLDVRTCRKGYLLTRPDYMGNMFSRKALYDLRLVGQRTTPDSKHSVIVLVSNDNKTWYRLKSLKSLSAKYYRYLVLTNMADQDTLSGISIQFDERYTDKFR